MVLTNVCPDAFAQIAKIFTWCCIPWTNGEEWGSFKEESISQSQTMGDILSETNPTSSQADNVMALDYVSTLNSQ